MNLEDLILIFLCIYLKKSQRTFSLIEYRLYCGDITYVEMLQCDGLRPVGVCQSSELGYNTLDMQSLMFGIE